MNRLAFLLTLGGILLVTIFSFQTVEEPPKKIGGLNFVAPPRPFQENPMLEVQAINADWIAVVPFAYSRVGNTAVHYNSGRQWWGERPEGCAKTIDLAQEAGIKVLLKPQVYVPGSWTGGIDFETEADWVKWETEYEAYLMPMVKMAAEKNVAMFCIGTEFKLSSKKRVAFWRTLIQKIRQQYKGELTYAANWDEYKHITFWDDLDYIGVDAYFPLNEAKLPSVRTLKMAWQPTVAMLERIHQQFDKPILFTEFGYMSVDGCAGKTWELEDKVGSLAINEQAQANALEALFSVFYKKKWWAGGFLWKWFPEGEGHEGYKAKDYTPQDKIGAKVVRDWYGK